MRPTEHRNRYTLLLPEGYHKTFNEDDWAFLKATSTGRRAAAVEQQQAAHEKANRASNGLEHDFDQRQARRDRPAAEQKKEDGVDWRVVPRVLRPSHLADKFRNCSRISSKVPQR